MIGGRSLDGNSGSRIPYPRIGSIPRSLTGGTNPYALLNREALLLHEAHPIVWGTGPLAVYNRFLTALDFRYFRMWGEYYDRLLDARARGADEDEERAIAREVFAWQPSGREAEGPWMTRCLSSSDHVLPSGGGASP